MFAVFFICVLANVINVIGADSISIDIIPETCIATIQKAVQISCVPDSVDKEVTVIEISRNDGKPIAYLSQCSDVSYGPGHSNNFKAEGKIDKHSGQSYLNLTLTKPRSEDTGIYTCSMYYLDREAVVTQARTSKTLVVEKLDVSSLETVLNDMKEEIRQLKKQRIDSTEKASAMTAFSAMNNQSNTKASAGEVVVFPDVIMKFGEGYDPKTGVFTAPLAGFYVFHVSVEMACGACHIRLSIRANDRTVGKLLAGDASYVDQSSISSFVQLSKGDTVKIFTDHTTGHAMVKSESTVFTGYLVKPQ